MNPSDDPRIAICMTTFDPPADLFRRQVDSIRAQTYENWTCLIGDDDSPPAALATIEETVGVDPRFRLERNPRRLGIYRNFERVLGLVPAEAELVALADQDDRWNPDKLKSLRRALDGGAVLAYSDMRVTDEAGAVVAPTFWTARRNNPDDLGAMVIANSITGGAAIFRRQLLDPILPFPDRVEGLMHDHWIAIVALSLGEVAYVDRPLYDYVQHEGSALGHEGGRPRRAGDGLSSFMQRGSEAVLGVRAAAAELLRRGGESIPAGKRRALRRLARIERSPACWAWLTGQMARSWFAGSRTMGAERFLLAGLLWRATRAPARLLRPPARDR